MLLFFNCNKDLIQPKQVLSSSEFFSNAQGTPLPSLVAIYGNQEPRNSRARSGTNVGGDKTELIFYNEVTCHHFRLPNARNYLKQVT